MADPKRTFFSTFNYKPSDVEQIAHNLLAKIMVSALNEDTKYLNVVAPGSKVGPLLKDCLAISLKKTDRVDGNPTLHLEMSDNLKNLVKAEIEAKEEEKKIKAEGNDTAAD